MTVPELSRWLHVDLSDREAAFINVHKGQDRTTSSKWVGDFDHARDTFGWLLTDLGLRQYQQWENGIS